MTSERVTLIYLHGFLSSPQSTKARMFGAAVAALPDAVRPRLVVPNLAHRPAQAIASVVEAIEAMEAISPMSLAFVGSSLGGFYATHLAERLGAKAVLINPTVRPFEDLRPRLGPQVNMYTGETFEVTDAHLSELCELAVTRISRPERYFLLAQTGDEVLDYRAAVDFYAGARQFLQGGGDHAFADFEPQIPAILRFCGVQAL
jgi:predicted esterase YcpF (UPF0227 family)